MDLIQPEELVGEEWAEWYGLTPAQRFSKQQELWAIFFALGGNLDPDPDPQSPFFDEQEWRENATHGRSGVRLIRRGGI